ncbi:MAG: T9SS type A sorting domain-containing protein [Ignavibacterium sp.]|nr:T9SS type A sorting domain-containing protein [Ignavibacterium sp.]
MFSGNTEISWEFTLQARDSIYTDTLYSASNSVNADGSASSDDKWNFGDKFVVHVIDQPSSVGDDLTTLNSFSLNQNYPNPFNPSTKISWQSTVGSHQILTVYDAIGTEVATLLNEFKEAGKYEIDFNASALSSGVYYYKLQAGSFIETKKMLLLR